MKFRIRFADQIVGIFIITALVSIIFIIVTLGMSHRWFTRDATFYTELDSVTGISKNMPVLYKGFTVGNVKDFSLNERSRVTVSFSIYSEHRDRVKKGSMVEAVISPIGLGNQFVFHPGKGDELIEEGSFLPTADSPEARALIRGGFADDPQRDDSISLLLKQVSSVMDDLDDLVPVITEALKGTDETELGRLIGGVNQTIDALPDTIDRTVDSLLADVDKVVAMVEGVLKEIDPIIADIGAATSMAVAPDGIVTAALDVNGEVYKTLVDSLRSLFGIIDSVEQVVAFIPGQVPQLAALIVELRGALRTADDVLTGLANNPLLKNGIPDRVDVQASGTNPRIIQF